MDTSLDHMAWTNAYYEFEALTNELHVHYSNVPIMKDLLLLVHDLLLLVHSAQCDFDYGAEVWPRVRDALDDAFKSPQQELHDAIENALVASNLENATTDPKAVQGHLAAAMCAAGAS